MAEEEVFRIVIEVKTESAETSVHRVRDELEKTEGSALELNAALELLKKGFEAVKEVLSVPFDLVRDFDKVFVSTSNLRGALAGVGDASEESFQHVQELVKELSETSRFSQVAIRDAAKLATTYGDQGDQLERVIRLATDYAQREGVDVATGVARVQHAMETGNIVIQRVSQNVSQLTDANARASDVLDKLGQRFRGAAQAATQGGAGGLIQLGKAFDEFKETLGGVIAESPEFIALINTITDGVVELTAVVESNKDSLGKLFGTSLTASLDLFVAAAKLAYEEIEAIFERVHDIYKIVTAQSIRTLIAKQLQIAAYGWADEDPLKFNEQSKAAQDLKAAIDAADAAYEAMRKNIADHPLILLDSKPFFEDLKKRMAAAIAVVDQFRHPTVGTPATPQLTTAQTDVLSKLDHGLDNYEAHLRVIDDLEKKNELTEAQAHELRLKFAQEDLAASKSWTAGIVRAYAAAQDAAENYAQVVVDAFGVAHDSIVQVLDKLENYNKNTWRTIASDALHAIEEIVNKLIASRILGLIGQGLAGIALGGNETAIPARAQGGPVIGGQTYIVGEHEPELFTSPRDGQITPLSKLAGASTQRPVVVKIVNVTDPDEIERYLTSSRGERVVKNVMGRGRVSSLGGI